MARSSWGCEGEDDARPKRHDVSHIPCNPKQETSVILLTDLSSLGVPAVWPPLPPACHRKLSGRAALLSISCHVTTLALIVTSLLMLSWASRVMDSGVWLSTRDMTTPLLRLPLIIVDEAKNRALGHSILMRTKLPPTRKFDEPFS